MTTPSRPYLLRSLYEWVMDNNMTPYINVDAFYPGAQVPEEFAQGGRIVFDISPSAVAGLVISNLDIDFHASFSGRPRHIIIPIAAVGAIYAFENSEGMVFGDEPGGDTPPDNSKFSAKKGVVPKKASHLKVVK